MIEVPIEVEFKVLTIEGDNEMTYAGMMWLFQDLLPERLHGKVLRVMSKVPGIFAEQDILRTGSNGLADS